MFRTLVALTLLGLSGVAAAAPGGDAGTAADAPGLRDRSDLLASRPVRSAPSRSATRAPARPPARNSTPAPARNSAPAPARRSAPPPARRSAPPARPSSPHAHRRPPARHHVPPRAHTHRHVHPHHRYGYRYSYRYYGPRYVYVPHHHRHVYVHNAAPPAQRRVAAPALDRSNSLALGLRMGSFVSGQADGPRVYSDPGIGLAARYRPSEGVGLEVAVQHHNQSWSFDTARSQTLLSGSLELFAFPSSRLSPYVLGGLTYNARDLSNVVVTPTGPKAVTTTAPLAGPHVGAGLELALGDSLALDLEARYISFWAGPAKGIERAALTTTAGLMVHF